MYVINGTKRDWMYFLADGIYPEWSIFVKTFSNAVNPDKVFFASHQEAVWKDVECAFWNSCSKIPCSSKAFVELVY
jgi:hypothetical protein